jgi:hypothetical protein
VRYFLRRDDAGSPELLLRMSTSLPEYLGEDGAWHPDATLVRHFVGDDAAEEIDETTATQLAEGMGRAP